MLIQCEGLVKKYESKYHNTDVFKSADLEITEGDFVGITGRSGSGKSTLLNILGFLDTPDDGKYIFNGTQVDFNNTKKLNMLRRENISFIRQDYGLIDEYNAAYNIALPLKYMKRKTDEIDLEVNRVAELFDIKDKLKEFPPSLSGGECQRVAIARAVIGRPLVILADEPTGSLDVDNENNVMNILREINSKGTTIIIATHSRDIAVKCNTLVLIQQGKIIKTK